VSGPSGTRQRIYKKKRKKALLSAYSRTLSKPSSGIWCHDGAFAECMRKGTRQRTFADQFFPERSLPSAALGKGFAECKGSFAECPWHSAKRPDPVVTIVGV
jgi:hypothetical protein